LGEAVKDTLEYSIGRCCGVPVTAAVGETPEGTELRFLPRPRYALQIGTAAKARDCVCGDVTEQLQSGSVRYLLLCDGMGTGANAAMDAKMTALFTARLLRAGFPCDVAARLVNAALLTRAPGDRGSTLDALCFDGMDGSVTLYKAGACAAYLLQAGSIRRLGEAAAANGLPLGSAGAVKDVRPELSLQPGDVLVMVSDGMLTGGEETLLQALKALQPAPPQVMAQALLAAVAGSKPEDDCTAAVLRVAPFPTEKER
jgi:stage II sporulation protein E